MMGKQEGGHEAECQETAQECCEDGTQEEELVGAAKKCVYMVQL